MKPELTPQTDEQQIREVIESQLAALSAKDVEGSINVYAKDNVMYTLAPPLRSQNDDIDSSTKAVQDWFDAWEGPLKYETSDLRISVSGDLAYSTSLRRMIGDQKGKHVDMWFRKSLVFQRIDGQWKIVHDHESVPFCMDGSLKAAVDLTP